MHWIRSKKLAVSLAVGAALASSYPANLNAITAATPYPLSTVEATNTISAAGATTPRVLAQAVVRLAAGAGDASGNLIVEEPGAMDVWLAKLEFQESHGNRMVKVLDVNGKYSYGCLQFQEGTFRNYGLKYGLISPKDQTEHVIYDCELQKQIAKLMLAENYSNWRAWFTSVKSRNVGMPPKPAKETAKNA